MLNALQAPQDRDGEEDGIAVVVAGLLFARLAIVRQDCYLLHPSVFLKFHCIGFLNFVKSFPLFICNIVVSPLALEITNACNLMFDEANLKGYDCLSLWIPPNQKALEN